MRRMSHGEGAEVGLKDWQLRDSGSSPCDGCVQSKHLSMVLPHPEESSLREVPGFGLCLHPIFLPAFSPNQSHIGK